MVSANSTHLVLRPYDLPDFQYCPLKQRQDFGAWELGWFALYRDQNQLANLESRTLTLC